MNWVGRVNRMDSKRQVSQVFNNNSQGSQLRGLPKNGWWKCVQILINAKLLVRRRGQKTDLTGRSPLSTRSSTLNCSATEEKVGKLFI